MMRIAVIVMAAAGLLACDNSPDDAPAIKAQPAAVTFDGGTYADPAAKIAHGKRMAELFGCNACHGADYAGVNFGELVPIVDGLWASNISRAMPAFSDAELERLLRTGVHPDRELYIMPSKGTQFLSKPDMAALIAFLRTVPPKGEPTPLPPAGFEAAVTARLPDDYWRTLQDGEKRGYHNAAEEVAYFAAHQPPKLGPSAALDQGRYVAMTVCSGCHGAALDGIGEDAGGIQAALLYNDAEFDRLLTTSVSRDGRQLKMEWGFGHEVIPITKSEKLAAIAYTRALARKRAE